MFTFKNLVAPVLVDRNTITARVPRVAGEPASPHAKITLRRVLHNFDVRLQVAVEVEGKDRLVHDCEFSSNDKDEWRKLEDRAARDESNRCDSIRKQAVDILMASKLWTV